MAAARTLSLHFLRSVQLLTCVRLGGVLKRMVSPYIYLSNLKIPIVLQMKNKDLEVFIQPLSKP